MNSIDQNPDYKATYAFVKAKYKETEHFHFGPHDETYFSLRVYETVKEIINKLNKKVKTQQILVAAILHDVGKTEIDFTRVYLGNEFQEKTAKEEWSKHPKLSVPIAQEFLKKAGHSDEFIDEVSYLIEYHDARGDEMDSRSIELEVLQDADLVADCGFAGFLRPFLYGAKFSRSVTGSIKYLKKEINRVMHEGQLNLGVSKKIAEQKIALEQKLIKEVAQDLDSDLL